MENSLVGLTLSEGRREEVLEAEGLEVVVSTQEDSSDHCCDQVVSYKFVSLDV